MIDGLRPGGFIRRNDVCRRRLKQFLILVGTLPSALVPAWEVLQLDTQDPGLKGVEAPVVALHVVVVLFCLPMIANHANLIRQFLVIGRDYSCLAARAQILSWIEAKGGRLADRTSLLPTLVTFGKILGAVGLAGILDYHQVVTIGKLLDCVHLGALSIQVYWDHRRYRSPSLPADQLAFKIERAMVLQKVAQLLGIHVVGPLIDIDELGERTSLRNRFRRGDKSIRHRNDRTTFADARCHQGKAQRVRAAVHADRKPRLTESRKRSLEFFDHWPADEHCRSQHSLKNGNQLLFKFFVKAD